MDDSVNNLFKLGLVAGAAYIVYLIYTQLQAPAAAVSSAYNAATDTLANAIVNATHTAAVPNGNVGMANGTNIPVSSFTNLGFDSTGVLVFQYAGTNYAISPIAGNAGAYTAAPYPYATLQGLAGAFTARRRRRGMR